MCIATTKVSFAGLWVPGVRIVTSYLGDLTFNLLVDRV